MFRSISTELVDLSTGVLKNRKITVTSFLVTKLSRWHVN